MASEALYQNFNTITRWNGRDNLNDLIIENPTPTTDRDHRRITMTMRCHPVINILLTRGFKIRDIIAGYGETIESIERIMHNFLSNLAQVGMVAYNPQRGVDIDPNIVGLLSGTIENIHWMTQSNAIFPQVTNGNIITNLISSGGSSLDRPGRDNPNPLQGTLLQVFILHAFIRKPWFSAMKDNLSKGSRIDRYIFYKDFFDLCINFDMMGSGHDEDLDQRAFIVSSKIIQNLVLHQQCDRLLTVDGHGRLIRRVLRNLLEFSQQLIDNPEVFEMYAIFLNNLKLRICEINIGNDLWHSNTLPVDPQEGYFSDSSNSILIEQEIQAAYNGNGIVYFNFSGLIGQGDRCIEIIRIFTEHGQSWRILISFSGVRGAADLARRMSIELERLGFHRGTDRSIGSDEFVTYIV